MKRYVARCAVMTACRPKLGYWRARECAEPIRMLLAHLQVDFEDKTYEVGGPPDFSQMEWLSEKATLPLAFPSLPYFIDGDLSLTESWAILKYICGKYRPEYNGRTLKEEAHLGMLQGVLTDLRVLLDRTNYSPRFAELKPAAAEAVAITLGMFAKALEGRRFLVGDEPTHADFFFFELLQHVEAWEGGLIAGISSVFAAYTTAFRSLPHIAAFETRTRYPFHTKTAYCLNA